MRICPRCICCISGGAQQSLTRKTTTRLISVTQLLAEPSDCWFICSDTHPLAGDVSLHRPLLRLLISADSLLTLSSLPPHLTPLWMPVASSHGADDSHTPVSGIAANSSLILLSSFLLLCFLLIFFFFYVSMIIQIKQEHFHKLLLLQLLLSHSLLLNFKCISAICGD